MYMVVYTWYLQLNGCDYSGGLEYTWVIMAINVTGCKWYLIVLLYYVMLQVMFMIINQSHILPDSAVASLF